MKRTLSRRAMLQQAALLLGTAGLRTAIASEQKPSPSLVDLVNPLQGTNSNFGFSRGNTLPIVSRPFGMTHWSMQTRTGDGWFFDPNALSLQGVRATHQPSPWIGDYGNITVMAQAGEPIFDPSARASHYDPADLIVKPHYLSVRLQKRDVRLEMAPTERCAIFRFTVPSGKSRVLLDVHSRIDIDAATQTLSGFTRHKSGGAPKNFACYFYARFDSPLASAYPLREYKPLTGQTSLETSEEEKSEVGVAVEFEGQPTVTLRIGTSFISVEQAKLNLEREIGTRGFDAIRTEAAQAWNETLGTVRISGASERELRTFYSCLYRTNLFPRPIHEYAASGKIVHYSPYDGIVHDGVLYTDTGLWDGYRTQYPLLALLQPQRLGEIVQGFLNAYKEGGWLPQWPSPGSRGGMGGTHSDAVLADALLKAIPGFDPDTAFAAIWKNATVPTIAWDGRPHLAEYLAKGYVAGSVSNSLDFAYDDACIALAAQHLGKTDEYRQLSERALNYRHLYDSTSGFMRSKNEDGSWQANFDEYAWGGPYTEGGAWQWTWAVPHDPAGLMALMGGQKPFLRKLDRVLLQPPLFHVGGYGQEIHEMREMAAVPFGQYDQGNQPGHHILSLFTAAGCPWKTQYWSRRVVDTLYSPDGFAGDEDNGEMAAWYIFNALGFYPLCTGHPSYVLGSPLFRDVHISLQNGKTLRLSAPNNSRQNVYVRRVSRNGQPHDKLWFSHAELAEGGTVTFAMAVYPDQRPIRIADLPFSFSPYDPNGFDPTASSTEIRIHCGGNASGEFVGDCFFEGGRAVSSDSAATGRQGPCVYRIPLPMLPENHPYHVRLHLSGNGTVTLNGRKRTAHEEITEARPDQDGAILIEIDASGILHSIEIIST